ncbi:hypothetical protein [Brevundimonas sp.]|uniref:hypothetical protein n=1 Tax=Brevundimonas sp. TaxID=1871086 RepID=UPI0025C2C93C|nr:hypothetical protein [Brevundimonas sp.]
MGRVVMRLVVVGVGMGLGRFVMVVDGRVMHRVCGGRMVMRRGVIIVMRSVIVAVRLAFVSHGPSPAAFRGLMQRKRV